MSKGEWLTQLQQRITDAGWALEARVLTTGVSYRFEGQRVFKLCPYRQPRIELNRVVPDLPASGYEVIDRDRALEKHMGRMVGLYTGDLETAWGILVSLYEQLCPPPRPEGTHYAALFQDALHSWGLLPFANWQVFKLEHGPPRDAEQHRERLQEISAQVGIQSGLYVYTRADGQVLYVGKAKRLKDRLKSHYVESFQPVSGDTRHQTWHCFFRSYPEILNVHWFPIADETDRQILEKMLDQFLQPVFDAFAKDHKQKSLPHGLA